jgi:hypothetical protein
LETVQLGTTLAFRKKSKNHTKHGRHKCSILSIKTIEAANNGEQNLWSHSKLPIRADIPFAPFNPTEHTIKIEIAPKRITLDPCLADGELENQ